MTTTLIPDSAARAEAVQALVADAIVEMPDGTRYMQNAKGALMPIGSVRETERLEDQMVRALVGYALDLQAQMTRFKGHCQADVGAFLQLLGEKYNATKGGAKGNMTFTSYNGRFKIQIAVADRLTFGPEFQVARALIDECLAEWSGNSRQELRAIITEAFQTDKEGKVSKDAVFRLMRVEIDDQRWRDAVAALRDSVRVEGSKSYIRFYQRDTPEAAWQAIPLDLAAV